MNQKKRKNKKNNFFIEKKNYSGFFCRIFIIIN